MPGRIMAAGNMQLKNRRHLLASACIGLLLAMPVSAEFARAAGTPPATLAIKDMTWVELRDAVEQGYRTILVPTGGIEQNGPQMALGKHDYIVSHAASEIAAKLGNTLVAPVVSFVPEGDFDPPTGNMRFPGTIGLREPVFEMVLEDIARSLKSAGFKSIVFMGDHGQSQAAQTKVARRLSEAWSKDGVRVENLAAYYDDRAQYAMLGLRGEKQASIGVHAGLIDTSELLGVRPGGVHLDRAAKADLERLGASGEPARSSAGLGRELLAIRIEAAVAEIKALQGRR